MQTLYDLFPFHGFKLDWRFSASLRHSRILFTLAVWCTFCTLIHNVVCTLTQAFAKRLFQTDLNRFGLKEKHLSYVISWSERSVTFQVLVCTTFFLVHSFTLFHILHCHFHLPSIEWFSFGNRIHTHTHTPMVFGTASKCSVEFDTIHVSISKISEFHFPQDVSHRVTSCAFMIVCIRNNLSCSFAHKLLDTCSHNVLIRFQSYFLPSPISHFNRTLSLKWTQCMCVFTVMIHFACTHLLPFIVSSDTHSEIASFWGVATFWQQQQQSQPR